ncbi:hypothetical protein ACFFQF_00835 [Haladaptatus pallidirubidus]|nr:hypothetical protein [Haladaptatus pallidirubidus]
MTDAGYEADMVRCPECNREVVSTSALCICGAAYPGARGGR